MDKTIKDLYQEIYDRESGVRKKDPVLIYEKNRELFDEEDPDPNTEIGNMGIRIMAEAAIIMVQKGRYREAIPLLDRVIPLTSKIEEGQAHIPLNVPEYYEALLWNRGIANGWMDRGKESYDDLNQLIKISPNNDKYRIAIQAALNQRFKHVYNLFGALISIGFVLLVVFQFSIERYFMQVILFGTGTSLMGMIAIEVFKYYKKHY